MPRVILSSGHTESNPGTIANGLREVDVARSIARATLPYLRQNGIISLSVPPEQDMQSRIQWINKSGYSEDSNDITIEIHINDGGGSGALGWYESEGNNNSSKLTNALLQEIDAGTELKNVGAKSEYDHDFGSLAFLHETHPVAALLEVGYIDNEKDARYLKNKDNIDKIGKSIAKGILKYYGMDFREGSAKPQKPAKRPTPTQPKRDPVATNTPPPVSTPPVRPISPTPINSTMPSPGGFSPPGGAGGFPPPGGGNAGGSGFTPMPSRDERKEIITKAYVKILGREPNQNDLNYFLNIGITEDQLIKKMIESQEHADLVKARQEVITTKKKYNDQQTELIRLRNQVKDQHQIMQNLQHSINEKNRGLAEMQNRITHYEKSGNTRPQQGDAGAGRNNPGYNGSFLDKLFRAFSDLFE